MWRQKQLFIPQKNCKSDENQNLQEVPKKLQVKHDNNPSNTKRFEPVPQNKEKLCQVYVSEKHEIKDSKSKRNIYIVSLKRN